MKRTIETIIIGNDGKEYVPGRIPARKSWLPVNAFTRSTGTGTPHLAAERKNRATRGELPSQELGPSEPASPDPSRAEGGER